nr:metal-dependent hydrolase [uncultured Methanoregula sp.]
MFFFFHLLTGIIIGFLIADLLNDRRWVLPCAIGSILPDLIDKPLGLVIFPTTIGDGRIFTHTLLIAIIILALGIFFWKRMQDPSVLALGIGLFSHQVLDMMWIMPSNWYYPFLGPFKGGLADNYIWVLLAGEIQNSFDLGLAFIITGIVLIAIFYHYFAEFIAMNKKSSALVFTASAILLCAISGILIGWGIGQHKIPWIGWSRPEEVIIGGIIFALAAWLLWRWQRDIQKG